MSGAIWNSVRAAAVAGQRVQGTAANDVLNGGTGNDTVVGLGGNDQLIGGAGTDVASFAGTAAQFRIDAQGRGEWRVQDTASKGKGNGQGTDFLTGIERVAFDDRMILLVDNRGPVATNDSFSMQEDGGAITLDILANDSDPDGDAIFLSGVTNQVGGSVSVVNGKLVFTADPNFFGTASFTYTITESLGSLPVFTLGGARVAAQSSTATVTINVAAVNDAPTGSATAVLAGGTEDTAYTVSAAKLLQGFGDVDGDTLSVSALSADHGTAVQNLDGSWTITPAPDYNGALTLTYTVSDGHGGIAAGTLTATLAAVNDAPTGSATAVLGDGAEDTAYTVSVADLVQGFDDIDGDTLSVSALSADHGTAVQNLDGSWTITPALNYNGPLTLTYTVSDGHGGTAAGSLTATLIAVNDAPEGPATGALAGGTEDTVYHVSEATLLAGFTDVENDPLTIADLQATNGTLVASGDGWDFTPDADYNGIIELIYKVSDGNGGETPATRTAFLDPVNDAPTGAASMAMADGKEDTAYTITKADLLTGFSDVDGDTLSVENLVATHGSIVANPDGTWTFNPDANYHDGVTLTYMVADGHGASVDGTQSLWLGQVNDLPVGVVTIDGTPEVGQVLTASDNLTDVDGKGPVTYVWQRGSDALGDAGWQPVGTGDSYTVQAADLGFEIRAVATYTDLDGNDDSMASAAEIPTEASSGGPFQMRDMYVYVADQAAYENHPLVPELMLDNYSPNLNLWIEVTDDSAAIVHYFDGFYLEVELGSGTGIASATFLATDYDLPATDTATLTRERVAGGAANYDLSGGNGADIFLLPTGGGTVDAGDGNDFVEVQNSTAAVVMMGGAGNDILVAINNSALVTLLGGAGNDQLTSTGNTAGAILDGGAGRDVLSGDINATDRGASTFVLHKGEAAADEIWNFLGGLDGDRIELVGYGAGSSIANTAGTSQWVITDGVDGTTETISLFTLAGSLAATDYAFV